MLEPKDFIKNPASVLGKAVPKPKVDLNAGFSGGEQTDEVSATTKVPGIGEIGKWMVSGEGGIANWGGELLGGKSIREVINVILVDEGAKDAAEAESRVLEAMEAAGFPLRTGHSSGYHGYIDGERFDQRPNKVQHAFSDRPFIESNTHGRIFGVAQTEAGWVSIAALSSEIFHYGAPPKHEYGSFKFARDLLIDALDKQSEFKKAETVALDNAARENDAFSTGDHDGYAVVVRHQ